MTSHTLESKFLIGYHKPKHLDGSNIPSLIDGSTTLDVSSNNVYNLQNYNPIYDLHFTMSNKNHDSIQLNHCYHFRNNNLVTDSHFNTLNKPSFIKYSPLLDPLRYMVGKYEDDREFLTNLPYSDAISNDISHNVLPKLKSTNNCAYVDTFFCYLSSMAMHTHNITNSLDFYGSYLGIQSNHKCIITDDIDFLVSSYFFNENINNLFTLENVSNDEVLTDGSRCKRNKLCISKTNKYSLNAIELDDIITDIQSNIEPIDSCIIYDEAMNESNIDKNETMDDDTSSSSDDSSLAYTTDSNESNADSDDEDDWETESDGTECDGSELSADEQEKYAIIKDFPVQLICLEKCDGTFDDLFTNGEITDEIASSALFQVIMSLITYQKLFLFTHNDLHTNNIMYINTEIPYLYYKFENNTYKVPTFGKIYKIIDFGRSIYTFNNLVYCSDSFAPSGDADTQYNTEPFFNENKPRIEPNMSFDLCRLGCSIYDFIIPDQLEYQDYDELQKTIHRWCLDDNGKNVLYKKNGDERYPDFKLYKMIARTVHKHTPQEQLKFDYFNQYLSVTDTAIDNIMNIDTLPTYY